MSITAQRICVLGGTGFIGHHIVGLLAAQGRQVRVLTRHRERHRELLVLPTVEVVEANAHDPAVLAARLAGCDAVINLVGILNGSEPAFQAAHVDLPRKVIEACRANGVRRLLHMSALHAAVDGPSQYLRSKGAGEQLMAAATDLHVTRFRPSVVFGVDDSFCNRFLHLLRLSPYFFPLAAARARFAPVHVGDVAQAYVRALDNRDTWGEGYDLCGPHIYTLQQIVEFVAREAGLCRKVLPLGPGLSGLMASLLQFAPGKPLTPDNLRSLSIDSVCQGPFPAIFGIEPAALEAIMAPHVSSHHDKQNVYQQYRSHVRRD